MSNSEILDKFNEPQTKELICLFQIEELISQSNNKLPLIINEVINLIPKVFENILQLTIKIQINDTIFQPGDVNFNDLELLASKKITYFNNIYGELSIFSNKSQEDFAYLFHDSDDIFINTIVDRLANYLFYYNLQNLFEELLHLSSSYWRKAALNLTNFEQ